MLKEQENENKADDFIAALRHEQKTNNETANWQQSRNIFFSWAGLFGGIGAGIFYYTKKMSLSASEAGAYGLNKWLYPVLTGVGIFGIGQIINYFAGHPSKTFAQAKSYGDQADEIGALQLGVETAKAKYEQANAGKKALEWLNKNRICGIDQTNEQLGQIKAKLNDMPTKSDVMTVIENAINGNTTISTTVQNLSKKVTQMHELIDQGIGEKVKTALEEPLADLNAAIKKITEDSTKKKK